MSMPSNKIIFLIVYISEWPWYFTYFLHSCRYNPTVDFLILTDNAEPLNLPSNIRWIPYSMEQFKTDATKALGFEIALEHGYKICDFRPALGCIFADLIPNYDFWGYCDIDVIFGDIRAFMTDELLNEYDVISARHDYLSGCFSLFRNQPFTGEIFKQSKDYRKVFTNPQNFFFDETNFAFPKFKEGLHYSRIQTEVESMTHVALRLHEENRIKASFDFRIVEGHPGNMLWNKGKLIYRKEFEAMLYHLIELKREYSEPLDLQKQIPERFRIGQHKIYYRQ